MIQLSCDSFMHPLLDFLLICLLSPFVSFFLRGLSCWILSPKVNLGSELFNMIPFNINCLDPVDALVLNVSSNQLVFLAGNKIRKSRLYMTLISTCMMFRLMDLPLMLVGKRYMAD
jgi:hypothetical protein